MKNTGVLIANDVNKNRAKAVVGNFHRMGIANSVISTYDGRHIPTVGIIKILCIEFTYFKTYIFILFFKKFLKMISNNI